MEGPKVLIMQIFSARIDPKHNAQQCRALRFWVLADPTSTIFLKTILLRRTLTKTGFKTLMIFCGRKGANAQQCRALRFWFKKSSLKTTHTKNEIFFLHELRIEQISNPQQCRALRFLVECWLKTLLTNPQKQKQASSSKAEDRAARASNMRADCGNARKELMQNQIFSRGEMR
jgi:hypothetical protein